MSIEQLKKYATMVNIAEEIDDQELNNIGNKILTGFKEDETSSQEWMQDVKRVMDLATLMGKKKSTPLPNSANIKFPIITKACYEFSSRTYPEIIKDGKVVKARVIGKDITGEKQAQADRVCEYMNYQLLFQNTEWEIELDRLLNTLALIGFVCKKTYYDPVRSLIKSEICEYKDLVINAEVKSLEDARRISHVLHLHLNDLIEHARADVFSTEPVDELINRYSGNELDVVIDVIEQHCYLDLDDDKYEEPYVVTVLKESGKVLRIAPRYTEDSISQNKNKVKYIDAIQFFTDYHFLVSPKGKFQSVGFGILMLHLNETINTLLNQIVDAGQLSNLQGGYIDSRLKPINSGESLHDPGEWKKIKANAGINLRDGIYPIVYKEPSAVLNQLLGLLIQTSKDLSSSTDVMTGSGSADNAKTGAVMALQQAGSHVNTSIQRRVYRSLCSEYRKIFRLDRLYLDPDQYLEVLDDDLSIKQLDFDEKKINIIPVADPNLSSELQRSTKAQLLIAVQQLPGIDPIKATKRLLMDSAIDHPEDLMISDEDMEKQKNAPNPDAIKIQADIEAKAQQLNIKGRELDLQEKQMFLDAYKTECEILKMKTESILNLAQAEAAEAGTQMQDYSLQLDILQEKIQNVMQHKQMAQDQDQHNNEMAMRQQELNTNAQPDSNTMVNPPSDESINTPPQ